MAYSWLSVRIIADEAWQEFLHAVGEPEEPGADFEEVPEYEDLDYEEAAAQPVNPAAMTALLPTHKPAAMTQALFDKFLTQKEVITKEMVDAMAQNKVLNEEMFHDIVTEKSQARVILARVANLPFADGQPTAPAAVPLAKLYQIWREMHLKYDTDKQEANELSQAQQNSMSAKQQELLRYTLPPYYTADKKYTGTLYTDYTTRKFTLTTLDKVKCDIMDDRVSDAVPSQPDDVPEGMVFQGFDRDGSAIMISRKEFITFRKWERQCRLAYPAMQNVGNMVFLTKKKDAQGNETGEVIPWFSTSVLMWIMARLDQYVFDAAIHHRVNFANAKQGEIDFRAHMYDNLRLYHETKSWDDIFAESGHQQLKSLIQYQNNEIPRAMPKANSVRYDDDGVGPTRVRTRKQKQKTGAQKKGAKKGGQPQNAILTPYGFPTGKQGKGAKGYSQPGHTDAQGRTVVQGKPFFYSYQGIEYCVKYNRGTCNDPKCPKWHCCNYIHCPQCDIPFACKSISHPGIKF